MHPPKTNAGVKRLLAAARGMLLLQDTVVREESCMTSLPLQKAIGLAIAALALSACGGVGSTPAGATAPQAPAIAAGDDAAIHNVSGQYAGTVKDSVYGGGKANGDLAQYRSAAGGTLTTKYASETRTVSGAFTLRGTGLRGSGVGTADNVSCTFDESATYNSVTHRLTGSYHSFHKCGGVTETGTFDLKQRCYYARDWGIRNDAGGVKQC